MSTDRENENKNENYTSNEPISDPQKEITDEASGECREEGADTAEFKVADEVKNDGADVPRKKPRKNTVLWIFSAAIVVLCFVLFLFCYKWAYNDGGIIPPSFGVQVYHFYVVIVAILAAIFLKAVFEKRVRLWTLLIASVLLPVLCYQVNYHTLKKDGIFYPLVDDGGIFHFIVIGDYNFDGMNDEEYHRLYEERRYSQTSSRLDKTVICRVSTEAIGVGPALYASLDYNNEESMVTLKMHKENIVYTQIKCDIHFTDPQVAQKISFYEITDNGDVQVEHTVNDDGTVTLLFDADTCLRYQNESEKEYIHVAFRFAVQE